MKTTVHAPWCTSHMGGRCYCRHIRVIRPRRRVPWRGIRDGLLVVAATLTPWAALYWWLWR